jgi:hypothetical protein
MPRNGLNHQGDVRNECRACLALEAAWSQIFRSQFCISGTGHLGVEDLARDSSAMRKMCASAKKAAMRKVAALAAALAVDIELEPDDDARTTPPLPEAPLSADEAARMLGKSRRWVFKHAKRLPFVHRVSRKTLACDAVGLRRWLASRPR